MAAFFPAFAQQATSAEQEWKKQISVRLENSKRIPRKALGKIGVVRVGFVVNRTGKLVSSWLAENTGIAALDETALAIVERAQPFPKPPDGLSDNSLRMTVPFIFTNRPIPDQKGSGRKQEHFDWEAEEAVLRAKVRSLCRGC